MATSSRPLRARGVVLRRLLLSAVASTAAAAAVFTVAESGLLAAAAPVDRTSAPVAAGAATAVPGQAPRDPAAVAAALAPVPQQDLPGWRLSFTDDFSTPVAEGEWDRSPYARTWTAYDGFAGTDGKGHYSADRTLSVADGDLTMRFHESAGKQLISGVWPRTPGAGLGQLYGRWSVRFTGTPSPSFGAAFLLWPDSNTWDEGEIDFAEGYLDGGVSAYHHCLGDRIRENCATAETSESWSQWHVATVEWTPEGVTYYLDGQRLITSSVVPSDPMHLVLQGYVRDHSGPAVESTVRVDWVSIWTYDPSTRGSGRASAV